MVGFRASCGCALVLALTAVAAHAQTYTAPKTPWGDPDLQNIWSGDSAFGIPMQRPEALGAQAELTDKEFAEKVARDERTRRTPSLRSGRFAMKRVGHQVISSDVAHRRSTERDGYQRSWPGGRQRRTPTGTYGNGPSNGPEDFTAYDRCHAGRRRIDDSEIYGNGYRIVQAPGYAVIMAEMIHEARVIPARRT